jgi:hypothetical protein
VTTRSWRSRLSPRGSGSANNPNSPPPILWINRFWPRRPSNKSIRRQRFWQAHLLSIEPRSSPADQFAFLFVFEAPLLRHFHQSPSAHRFSATIALLRRCLHRRRRDCATQKQHEIASSHCLPQGQRPSDGAITAGIYEGRNGTVCTAAMLSRLCPLWVISGHRGNSNPCPLYSRKRTSPSTTGMAVSARCHSESGISVVQSTGSGTSVV